MRPWMRMRIRTTKWKNETGSDLGRVGWRKRQV
jgi:hypothetical protein